jgi:Immunoglobulin domain
MKKAFTLVVLIVTPTMAFAQGSVTFINGTAGLVKQWTCPTNNTLISVPVGGGYVELLTAPAGTPLENPLWRYSSLSNFLAANPGWAAIKTTGISPVAGRFNGGNVILQSIIPGGAPVAEYCIIGWTGSATSYDEAILAGAIVGSSPMLTTATGNDATLTPVSPAVSLATTFTGLILTPECLGPYIIFTTQPTNQTVVRGATVTFYVAAIACPSPLYYQWYFNGASIPGAIGSSFQISNVQLTNAGTYWVVLSIPSWGEGVRTSASAILTVLAPPIITSPPQSQTAYAGSTVDFRARATGSSPLAYQWFFNGSAISGAGSTYLQLTNLQSSQSGTYTVVVTNFAGAVTSPPAMFSVIPPVERRLVPGLSLLGQPGSLLNLEEANTPDPSPAWVTFDSVRLTNTSQWYFDVSTPLPPQRFYRAWQAGGLGVIPTLDLKMVPALTLTGSVGSSVRVDYINQFGPIDAWVALGTVTLTNTSQLYFDVSAPGQPPRLYRLVQVP